uniref:SRCR domain-containing protein n=1 Tax=Paramormyrops kingsleyae TaxID=1676925 RepID=A0A3B3TFF3_9TELE
MLRWCAGSSSVGRLSVTQCPPSLDQELDPSGWMRWTVRGMRHFNDIRLAGGCSGHPCAGRVEVLYQGQWGTVCGDDWDEIDATVVCRQLFCGEAAVVRRYGNFGPGTGNIWMDEVSCIGSESTLKECRSEGWGLHYDTNILYTSENKWFNFTSDLKRSCIRQDMKFQLIV